MARVLVVDDSLIMRKNVSELLKHARHSVVGEAKNGLEAYNMYNKLRPDLVTMDITMPVMSGIEAVKKIIDLDPDAKIIMISSLSQKTQFLKAMRSGAKHYLLKPIRFNKMIEVVNQVLAVDKIV